MKTFRSVALGVLLGAGGMMLFGQNERAMHPRISAAINELREAVRYMEAAPHNFGGHKEAAIRASREAIAQLNQALAYRGKEDRRR